MKNVMIVEDQKMIRNILEGYIRKADGFRLAFSIEGAEQAYEICETKEIHLILMDVQTAHREDGLAVKYHMTNMLQKTNLKNKLQLAVAASDAKFVVSLAQSEEEDPIL